MAQLEQELRSDGWQMTSGDVCYLFHVSQPTLLKMRDLGLVKPVERRNRWWRYSLRNLQETTGLGEDLVITEPLMTTQEAVNLLHTNETTFAEMRDKFGPFYPVAGGFPRFLLSRLRKATGLGEYLRRDEPLLKPNQVKDLLNAHRGGVLEKIESANNWQPFRLSERDRRYSHAQLRAYTGLGEYLVAGEPLLKAGEACTYAQIDRRGLARLVDSGLLKAYYPYPGAYALYSKRMLDQAKAVHDQMQYENSLTSRDRLKRQYSVNGQFPPDSLRSGLFWQWHIVYKAYTQNRELFDRLDSRSKFVLLKFFLKKDDEPHLTLEEIGQMDEVAKITKDGTKHPLTKSRIQQIMSEAVQFLQSPKSRVSDRLLTTSKACEYLGIDRKEFLRLEEAGILKPTIFKKRYLRYSIEILDEYLKAKNITP